MICHTIVALCDQDSYYMVRILEFVMMWILIIHQQEPPSRAPSILLILLFILLPVLTLTLLLLLLVLHFQYCYYHYYYDYDYSSSYY